MASRKSRYWSSFVTESTLTTGDSQPRGLGSGTASRSVPRNLYPRRLECSNTTDVRARVGFRGGDDHAPRAAGTERAGGARAPARGWVVSTGAKRGLRRAGDARADDVALVDDAVEGVGITGDEVFAEAANDAADYLFSDEARLYGYTFHLRNTKGKYKCDRLALR